MNRLMAAIVGDDRGSVAELLQVDPGLATRPIVTPKLHQSGLFHWIYAGDTALHLAAAGYRVEIVRRLLQAGADPKAVGNHRRSSPLHYAVDGFITGPAWDPVRQVETIDCLLQSGADLQGQDLNGATPLHRAVRTRCAAAVKALLSAGGDPTRKNKSGSTSFHLAVQNTGRGGSGEPAAIEAQREIIKLFLSFGADPHQRDAQGTSVAEAARSPWIRVLLGCPPSTQAGETGTGGT